ncbi:MAG TPA: DUF2189 domain-containing protein [Acetobacteraceae bacterium]|nr:DUF2189 domain-containing protein [Acetobacteraceae bacterium]
MTIQSPIAWGLDQLRLGAESLGSAPADAYWPQSARQAGVPAIRRRIGPADLREALVRGLDDFRANRTDVVFLCVMYPVIGLVLGYAASGDGLMPLLFPLAAGFALVGPVAAIGLNEMSRRREQGEAVGWTAAFGVLRSPAIGSIVLLAALLAAIFLVWLVIAEAIYAVTLGTAPPVSAGAFAHAVFLTGPGWALIVVGIAVGFVFAVGVFAISVVSFPMLLDANVGVDVAVRTSIATVRANPRTMALWGVIIAGGLVLGSIPLLVGLAVVLPVLGHATWHLYRRVVVVQPDASDENERILKATP